MRETEGVLSRWTNLRTPLDRYGACKLEGLLARLRRAHEPAVAHERVAPAHAVQVRVDEGLRVAEHAACDHVDHGVG